MLRTCLLLVLVGCGRSGEVDFPARLAPLEEVNKAPTVKPIDGDPYPEILSVAAGQGHIDEDGNEVYWAHARGHIKADLATVWGAAQVIDVCVDRREVNAWTVTQDTVPEFDVSFTIHNTVHDILTVNYDTTWVFELQEGSEDAPELVMAQWDKTEGPKVIDILRGSLVLRAVDDQVTEIELMEHLKATLRDEQTIARYLRDYYADLVAETHGRPLPAL